MVTTLRTNVCSRYRSSVVVCFGHNVYSQAVFRLHCSFSCTLDHFHVQLSRLCASALSCIFSFRFHSPMHFNCWIRSFENRVQPSVYLFEHIIKKMQTTTFELGPH